MVKIIEMEPNEEITFENRYEVNENKFFEVINYINGIKKFKEITKPYDSPSIPYLPSIPNKEGVICFEKPSTSKGYLIYSNKLRLSNNEELNKHLIRTLNEKINKN